MILGLTIALAGGSHTLLAQPRPPATSPRWLATWAPSLQPSAPRPPADSVDRVFTVVGRTLRQVARVSIGGTRVRLRLSNEYGDRPLRILSARVALRRGGAAAEPAIDPATDHVLTFDGRHTVVVRPGSALVSDGVDFVIPDRADVMISLAIADSARTSTRHSLSVQRSWVSPPGDHTADATFTPDTSVVAWAFVAGLDVVNPRATGVIVTLGNSITDGFAAPVDSNARWPDVLAARLLASRESPKAVVNAGISGNRVLSNVTGPSALLRFDRDVLMQPGVTHVVVLEGINDISRGSRAANPLDEMPIEELIAGHRQLIARAHERGLTIIGATLTPIGGMNRPAQVEMQAKHAAFNRWVRTSGEYDGVIDFEKATWDPADTTRFLPAYDSGDHLHPGGAGYAAMGKAIALELFRMRKRR
ncbi:MAG: SGNH/GDSL hydrolase family protein [Gemmatimonadetes bacterium]|nr:SGNH/GDSL hydrolase family protein [Gemmatimonadota bacterium]